MDQPSCLQEIRCSEDPTQFGIILHEGESDGSQPREPQTNDIVARNDFWTISGSFFVVFTLHQELLSTVPNDGSFPIPLEYIDVVRRRNTTKDVSLRSRIDDYWNINISQEQLSEPWTVSRRTQYWMKNLQIETRGLEGGCQKFKKSRPDLYSQRFGLVCRKLLNKKKNSIFFFNNEARQC